MGAWDALWGYLTFTPQVYTHSGLGPLWFWKKILLDFRVFMTFYGTLKLEVTLEPAFCNFLWTKWNWGPGKLTWLKVCGESPERSWMTKTVSSVKTSTVLRMIYAKLRCSDIIPFPQRQPTFYPSGAESELCVAVARFEYNMEQVLGCSWAVLWWAVFHKLQLFLRHLNISLLSLYHLYFYSNV